MSTREAVTAYRDAVNEALTRLSRDPDTDWGDVYGDHARLRNTIRAVLARHKPHDHGDGTVWCKECGVPMPCGTRRVIGEQLGIEAADEITMLNRAGGGEIRRDGDQITITPIAEVGDA